MFFSYKYEVIRFHSELRIRNFWKLIRKWDVSLFNKFNTPKQGCLNFFRTLKKGKMCIKMKTYRKQCRRHCSKMTTYYCVTYDWILHFIVFISLHTDRLNLSRLQRKCLLFESLIATLIFYMVQYVSHERVKWWNFWIYLVNPMRNLSPISLCELPPNV